MFSSQSRFIFDFAQRYSKSIFRINTISLKSVVPQEVNKKFTSI